MSVERPEPQSAVAAPAPSPAWSRRVPEARGRWRRLLLDLLLRVVVKRGLGPDAKLDAVRALNARMDERFAWAEPGMRRTSCTVGGVPCEWVDVPGSRPDRVILYLHGSAFAFRFPHTHAGLAARLCTRLAARALVVDYRLAPEDPYPAASDDCLAAYCGLVAEGVDPRSIVLAGDSAGGNLVLGTLHRLKAAGEPLPACAIAMSPVVDFTMSSPSFIENEKRDPIFTLASMLAFRRLYVAPERFLEPAVSPLFGDWSGLPPLLFQAASTEMLRDESVRAAERAHAAGTPVELEIYERMPHAFQVFAKLPMADAALDAQAAFVGRHAGWTDTGADREREAAAP
jgi:acetyl esterase/lipase